MDVNFYTSAGALTNPTPDQAEMIGTLDADPLGLRRVAQGLLTNHDRPIAGSSGPAGITPSWQRPSFARRMFRLAADAGTRPNFIPPRKVDHWIVEYWSSDERRWIRTTPNTSAK